MQKVLSVFHAMFHRKWTMGVAALVIFAAVVAGGFALQQSLSVGMASSCSSVYTARFGDILGRIALRYHSNVHAIAQASHIWNPDLIFPGQRLCIPASHRVSSGGGSDSRGLSSGESYLRRFS